MLPRSRLGEEVPGGTRLELGSEAMVLETRFCQAYAAKAKELRAQQPW